jgi:hypothetical protein
MPTDLNAGILGNPGVAYKDVGVTEEEVATLAEEKEGYVSTGWYRD